MFIFEKAPFKQCHASTVVEHEPGKLLAAWFAGDAEGAKNVQIWLSAFDGRAWSEPAVVGSEPGQPTWNPVLFKSAKGTLRLWYKAGPKPDTWTGYDRTSADGGRTWTEPRMLPTPMYGPVRAKPLQLADGAILAGTSVESYRNWTPYVDRSDDDGRSWTRSNPFPLPRLFGQIQPALVPTADGKSVVALMRSRTMKVCRSVSTDGGRTFSASEEIDVPNPSAGIDAVRTKAGQLVMIYNPTAVARTPISLGVSADDGKTWRKVRDLETEPGEYSYPALIETAAGELVMTYTWRRTHIKVVRVDPATLR
ncbi:sialidase family protein [Urbifossiella limnaea]|uniref:BNR/Asp-box repeat protein n=1 Tax=Urbifossiella limnaea TaxID=2528023 RepID=A0A517XT92_9BACT|nr:sialidase family protein [Urbifossiella limnaea]QDU20713.1 BNR/Asp-box repeat protein [Urbifossiella limnaea]